MNSYLKAISYYLPEKIITNKDLCDDFPEADEAEIFKNYGIKCRHISGPDEIGSDVGFFAAEHFFCEHQIKREDIDFLLFCTEGLDYKAPATSCILQHRLRLPGTCGALDIPYGCTGFVYGLSVSKGLIESGQAKNVLLITSDVPSKVIHPGDKELRILFGDGGAATLISATNEDKGIGQFVFGTDGSGYDKLIVRRSGTREYMTRAWLEDFHEVDGMKWGRMEMDSSQIFLFAMKVVPAMIRELLGKEGLSVEDIDCFVFHQANVQMLEVLRKKMKIPLEKFIIDMETTGNTVSASIPIALKNAMNKRIIHTGGKIVLCGFGIGLSWAATIVEI
ncbi:MAG TPA: ketoacyl-ACP synthase III [Bacteroidales bacterium]|nr:ketoacyl-ACP synthase III [Bacteroidales bacterium]